MPHPKVERFCRCGASYFYENGKRQKTCPKCRGIPYYSTLTYEEVNDPRAKKSRLIKERGHRCEVCKLESWMSHPIPLEIDHIDGDSSNDSRENVRLICPNCHAQTPTYKSKNRGNGRFTRMERYRNGQSF